jgi:hypothetical protein
MAFNMREAFGGEFLDCGVEAMHLTEWPGIEATV